jgi:uncharacterized membrane protein
MSTVNEKFEILLSRNALCIVFLFLFCFASFGLPLLSGLPSGFDMITDIRFASALKDAMLSGEIFPGWANDNFGFGSIGIRFYPPVAFYLLAFTEMLVADWFWTLWANLLFWMFLGSVGIYLFVKEWGTPTQGLIAGIGYAIVPQHLSEVFQFFLFAEFAAWGVIPFCFLFLTRICRNERWIDVALFAVSYSLLILTHLPTTIIVSLCFPLYVLFVMDWRKHVSVFVRLAAAIGLTLVATSFRWVTIVTEWNWLAHNDPKWATGYFQFSTWLFPNTLTSRDQFIYVLTSWLFDTAIVMTAALVIPGIVYLLKNRKQNDSGVKRILLATVVTTFFAFFMLSKPSQAVWEAFPFLQKLQFPWRWLSVLSFSAVVAFALSVPRLLDIFHNRRRLVAYPALALVVTIILFNITQIIIPSAPIPYAKFEKVEKEVAEEPMFEGWWPVWAKREGLVDNAEPFADIRRTDIRNWDSTNRVVEVSPGNPTDLIVPTFYYPHWKATRNGEPVPVSLNNNGVMTVPLTSELATVRLYFEEPLRNVLAGWISLAVWLLFGFVLISHYARESLRGQSRQPVLSEQPNQA